MKGTRLDAPAHAHQEADDRADQEHDEQHFRDARGADCDSAKSEERCDQRYDEKYDCIMKHGDTCLVSGHLSTCGQCLRW
jgi:hypothetical protein